MPTPNITSQDWRRVKLIAPTNCRHAEKIFLVDSPAAQSYVDSVMSQVRGGGISGRRQGGGRAETLTGISSLLAFGPDPTEMDDIGSYVELAKAGTTDVIDLRRSKPKRGGWIKRGFLEPQFYQMEMEPKFGMRAKEISALVFRIHERLHQAVEPRVLVHSEDGRKRAPTAIWLYLVAMGFSYKMADEIINASHAFVDPAPFPILTRDESLHTHLESLGKMMGSFREGILQDLFPIVWPE